MENAPKLTLTEYEFLKNEVAKTIRDDSQYRLGQAWFNELVAHLPQFGWVRATNIDPFHRDEVLLDLFFHILDEEAYASWTHSDDYKRLHSKFVKEHEATPVDTSGSELSDFLEGEYKPELSVSNTVLVEPENWKQVMEEAIAANNMYFQAQAEEAKRKDEENAKALTQWAEEDAVFEKEYIKAKDLIMENTITNASTSNTLMSTGTGSDTFLGNAVGSTLPGLAYSGNYEPKIEETTNVRLNITTHRSPLECVELLKQISEMLGTLEDIRVRNLEISQW